ncbi:MAG: hypothetical protein HC871_10045 [Rhizobiales bacterium]|nr:hypothetical protein [Hyphomicrobiales bacterium]
MTSRGGGFGALGYTLQRPEDDRHLRTQSELESDIKVFLGGTMAEDEGKAQAAAVLDVTLGVLYSGANTEKKLGLHVASDWEDMLGLMKEYNDLETDMVASDFYTNDFLP